MNKEEIWFTTRHVAGSGGVAAQEKWSALVLPSRTVDEDEFAAAVARRTNQSAAAVAYTLSSAAETLRDFLRQGCAVNLSDVGFRLTLTGTFPTADAAPDSARNKVRVRAHTSLRLAKAFGLDDLALRNTTAALTARIFSVMDAMLQEDGVIADPSRVLVTGERIAIDPSAADEGAWLLNLDGTVAAVATILANDAGSLDCSFASLPPPGEYRFAIRARNGADRSLAPALARKPVTVR